MKKRHRWHISSEFEITTKRDNITFSVLPVIGYYSYSWSRVHNVVFLWLFWGLTIKIKKNEH